VLKTTGIWNCNVRKSRKLDRYNKDEGIFNMSVIPIEKAGFDPISSKKVQCQSLETGGSRRSSMMLLMQRVGTRA
jgi:hypothetical protein